MRHTQSSAPHWVCPARSGSRRLAAAAAKDRARSCTRAPRAAGSKGDGGVSEKQRPRPNAPLAPRGNGGSAGRWRRRAAAVLPAPRCRGPGHRGRPRGVGTHTLRVAAHEIYRHKAATFGLGVESPNNRRPTADPQRTGPSDVPPPDTRKRPRDYVDSHDEAPPGR